MEPDVGRPDRELVEAFEEIPSTIISDVTGNIGLTMDAGLRPAYDDVEMAGTAVTVKAAPGDNLIVYKAIALTGPDDVLVISCDSYTDTGHIGELMCASCQANGLAGLVIDGAYRGSHEIAEMEFPVCGHGVNPQEPLEQDPDSVNVTVSIDGVNVGPNDIVIGDDDRLAVIPRKGAEEVLECAHEKLNTEDSVCEEVLKGEHLYELSGYDELFENLTIIGPEDSIR